MHWKAVIPGVLDVIWMLPFALINSKKNKLLCKTEYLKSRPKTQTASNDSENLSYVHVERTGTAEQQADGLHKSLPPHRSPHGEET